MQTIFLTISFLIWYRIEYSSLRIGSGRGPHIAIYFYFFSMRLVGSFSCNIGRPVAQVPLQSCRRWRSLPHNSGIVYPTVPNFRNDRLILRVLSRIFRSYETYQSRPCWCLLQLFPCWHVAPQGSSLRGPCISLTLLSRSDWHQKTCHAVPSCLLINSLI